KKSIRGKILDASNSQPIAGVSVKVVESGRTSSTDQNGQFTFSDVTVGNTVVVTSVGYLEYSFRIGNQVEYTINLTSTINTIEETVVVGYGTQKRRNVTGSIVSVGSEEIQKTTLQDPISILQGRAAGVQVTSNSGAPGGEMTIRVRGNSSLNSGNSPLFVVDGIPIESGSVSSLNGTQNFGLNPLADINPNDIASIEILKDAASTAIYGSRAANGVVLITTKRGAEGKPEIQVNATTGVSSITRFLSVLNARQYRDAVLESYAALAIPEEPYYTLIDSLSPMNNGDVDWQSELMRAAGQYKV